jgi:CheY-like chemotaxis protein
MECLDVLTDEDTDPPDIVILEVMIPRVDGFRALPEIGETHDPTVPVIRVPITQSRFPTSYKLLGAMRGSLRSLGRGSTASIGDHPGTVG